MSRIKENNETVTNDTEENVTTPDNGLATETPEVNDTASATADTATPEEPKVDLEAAFNAALAEGLEAAGDNPVVPDGPLNTIAAAYKQLRGGSRNKVMGEIALQMMEHMTSGRTSTAQAIQGVVIELQKVVQPAPKAPAEKVDPTEAYSLRVNAFRLAADYLRSHTPEGVNGNAIGLDSVDDAKITEVLTATSGDTDESKAAYKALVDALTPIESAVHKLVSGKAISAKAPRKAGTPRAASSGDGTRNDIAALTLGVLRDNPGQTLTAHNIVTKLSEGGFGTVSSGAVSNCIKDDTRKNYIGNTEGVTVQLSPVGARYDAPEGTDESSDESGE